MIELLFTAHNRLAFTQASFTALLANTDWDLVSRLHVVDDHSGDGTAEWLAAAVEVVPVSASFVSKWVGGPVAAMNEVLDVCVGDLLGKVDNDLIVCSGWLDAMLAVLESAQELDVLGFEPGFGNPVAPLNTPRSWRPGPHVGGIGLFRTRIFQHARPKPNGLFGWTEFQRQHANCGWITPDLPCFLLDHLPLHAWRSLADLYVTRGWSRAWPAYPQTMHAYWDWWLPETVPA